MEVCTAMATSGIRGLAGGVVKTSMFIVCRQSRTAQYSRISTKREFANNYHGLSKTLDQSPLRADVRFRETLHRHRYTAVCLCTLSDDASGSDTGCSDSGDDGEISDSSVDSGDEECARQPQDAVLQAISEVSKMEGRTAKTTNLVIGGTENPVDSDWLELDKKVNTYPSFRGFTAIGTGGLDFVQSMVVAVESVLQEPIAKGQVRQRESAQGRYISVKIGPMRVESSSQVREIYQAMRRDVRMKYFL